MSYEDISGFDPLFFFGDSETGLLAKSQDWKHSNLGNPIDWPLELKTVLGSMFQNRHPSSLYWGEELNYFYNDGYISIVSGSKHPHVMGKKGIDVWPEVWDLIIPQVNQVLNSGKPTWNEDQYIPIHGNDGKPREAYFTYSYSPIYLSTGKINGVLVTCIETTERVRSERKLNKTTQELILKSNAIENSLNGFDIVNEEGKFVYVNRAYVKMWGYDSAEEVLKTSPIDHCFDADIPLKIISNLKEKGECDIEFLAKRKDGSVFDVRMLAYVAHDIDGKEIYPTTSIDITETKRAFEKFSTVANNISQLTWMAESSGYITWYNQRWFDYTGTTLEQMQGWGWKQVHHPDHAERVTIKWLEHLQSGQDWEDTFPLRCKTGEYRWFLSRAHPIRDENGRLLHWFGTNTDITDKLRAEEALVESEEKFRTLAESMPQLVWTANADGAVDYYNSRMDEYLGADKKENGKWNWAPLLHPDDIEMTIQAWTKAVRDRSIYTCEHRVRMKDGSHRWHLSRGIPAFNKSGSISKWYGTATDIHDHKLREEALAKALAVRDEFLSIASHELKTPLTSLKLQAQLHARLQKQNMTEAFSKEKIEANSERTERLINRLDRLVDDMLDISRIRTGKLAIKKERADLIAVASEVVERLQDSYLETSGEKIKFSGPKELWAKFDVQRLEQVFQNLLQNALKYGQGKGVEVIIEDYPQVIYISVKDQGIGIDEEKQTKIFDRFERGISAKEISGMGLGLYICREIIQAHDGNIRVVSQPEMGATFRIELPH